MVINCKNCGGRLSYRIKENNLICSHCQSTFKVDEIDCSHLYSNDYTCESCGAGIIYTNDEIKLNKCPYCGSKSFVKMPLNTEYDYKGIVPFKIDKNELIELIKKHLEKEDANEEFILKINNANIRQVYLPYSYQDQFFNNIAFSSEDEYKNRKMKYESVFSNYFFKWAFQEIVPYKENDIKVFNPAYLENSVAYVITQQFTNNFFESRKPDYFLVPVWIVEINHKRQTYILVINGTSGELAGEYLKDHTVMNEKVFPFNTIKYIIFAILFLLIALILTLYESLLKAVLTKCANYISDLPIPLSFKVLLLASPAIIFVIIVRFKKSSKNSNNYKNNENYRQKSVKIYSKREKIHTRLKKRF